MKKSRLSEKEKKIIKTVRSFSNTPSGCYVHVSTGDGSGKTTSALGVALRSLGHGRKVAVIQFLKGRGSEIGEYNIQKKLKNFKVYQFGRAAFLDKDRPDPKDVKLARNGLELAKKLVQNSKMNLLVLDEINLTVYYKLLTVQEIIAFLDSAKRSKNSRDLDIYLTGRYCPKKLIDYADFATEIKPLKRPDCFSARKGIEF